MRSFEKCFVNTNQSSLLEMESILLTESCGNLFQETTSTV